MPNNEEEVQERRNLGGRPSLYKPEFVSIVQSMCRLGATDADLAEAFGVGVVTIWHWRARYEDFAAATRVGKELANERVERSLYQRAVGYTYDAVKVFAYEGDTFEHAIKEHVPPDTTACIFWLKNRDPNNWRDRREVTGADGGPVALKVIGAEMTTKEAADAYLDTLRTIDGEFSVVPADQQQKQIPSPAAKPAAKKKRAKKD